MKGKAERGEDSEEGQGRSEVWLKMGEDTAEGGEGRMRHEWEPRGANVRQGRESSL